MLVASVDDSCRLPVPRRQVEVVSHFSVYLTFYHIQLQQRHNLFPPDSIGPFRRSGEAMINYSRWLLRSSHIYSTRPSDT